MSGGRRGKNEEVRQEYCEGAQSSRSAALYAAGSGSTSAESEIREIRRDRGSDDAARLRSETRGPDGARDSGPSAWPRQGEKSSGDCERRKSARGRSGG